AERHARVAGALQSDVPRRGCRDHDARREHVASRISRHAGLAEGRPRRASRPADGALPLDRERERVSDRRSAAAAASVDGCELPAAVGRVAPLEETVDGVIAFPPSQWDGRPVEGLKLRFSKGRVVEIIAAGGKEAVEAEMQKAGDAGRAFREIGVGFNTLLAVPERAPWIPYYGYGAGVVRLSLGDNSELGGK